MRSLVERKWEFVRETPRSEFDTRVVENDWTYVTDKAKRVQRQHTILNAVPKMEAGKILHGQKLLVVKLHASSA